MGGLQRETNVGCLVSTVRAAGLVALVARGLAGDASLGRVDFRGMKPRHRPERSTLALHCQFYGLLVFIRMAGVASFLTRRVHRGHQEELVGARRTADGKSYFWACNLRGADALQPGAGVLRINLESESVEASH
jgi:hypothetical protein